jgi:non-specific serine/threonine protein kinase
MANIVLGDAEVAPEIAKIPCWHHEDDIEIDTVVYSSRKSFLREEGIGEELRYVDDAQFERYYKNYMQGMGETEKALVSAVSRLGRFPVVGGLVVRWQKEGVYIDSSLNLNKPAMLKSFISSVNNVVRLARAIYREGIFKSCMFNARDTMHVERDSTDELFTPMDTDQIHYEKSALSSVVEEESRTHSYFEDGEDPDELLQLPQSLRDVITRLNDIHHTGCIIFEALTLHLKVHSYYKLLDHSKEDEFRHCLQQIVRLIPQIEGEGISGFMKLPYKDTRFFEHRDFLPEKFYPKDPRKESITPASQSL